MLLTAALLTAALTLQVQPTPPVPQPPTPAAPPSEAAVAFARLEIPDGAGPAIEAGVWTPGADGGARRPLIVISHGNGGDFRSHEATARALAQAGFVVAALTHTGDNWRDQSRATDVAQRPRQLRVLIDYLLSDWTGRTAIDADRIGAFGFSAGGFTVLTAAGGEPDLGRIGDHCIAHPGFYDCGLIAARGAAAKAMEKVATPGKSTCPDVAELLGLPLSQTVKSLVLATDERNEAGDIVGATVWLLLVRGDHSLNEIKAGKVDLVRETIDYTAKPTINPARKPIAIFQCKGSAPRAAGAGGMVFIAGPRSSGRCCRRPPPIFPLLRQCIARRWPLRACRAGPRRAGPCRGSGPRRSAGATALSRSGWPTGRACCG